MGSSQSVDSNVQTPRRKPSESGVHIVKTPNSVKRTEAVAVRSTSTRKDEMAVFESPQSSSSVLANHVLPKNPVPVTFTWNLGGQSVFITGSFNNWKQTVELLPQEEDGEWKVVQQLVPGNYQYKFIVDDVWRHHPDQPTVHDEVGNINNFVEVEEETTVDIFPKRRPSPPGSYTQTLPSELNDASLSRSPGGKQAKPPSIPPHLLRALLNTAPSPADPSTLPLPHHVMVNHLYVLPKETVAGRHSMVMGATHMFRGKYVTTVYYKRDTDSVQQKLDMDQMVDNDDVAADLMME